MRDMRSVKGVFQSYHGEMGGVFRGNALFLLSGFHYSRSVFRTL